MSIDMTRRDKASLQPPPSPAVALRRPRPIFISSALQTQSTCDDGTTSVLLIDVYITENNWS